MSYDSCFRCYQCKVLLTFNSGHVDSVHMLLPSSRPSMTKCMQSSKLPTPGGTSIALLVGHPRWGTLATIQQPRLQPLHRTSQQSLNKIQFPGIHLHGGGVSAGRPYGLVFARLHRQLQPGMQACSTSFIQTVTIGSSTRNKHGMMEHDQSPRQQPYP